MGIDKLKRVMWRIREKNPEMKIIKKSDLEMAIMFECGTDYQTRSRNIDHLLKLGWLKQTHRHRFTCKDINNIEWSI